MGDLVWVSKKTWSPLKKGVMSSTTQKPCDSCRRVLECSKTKGATNCRAPRVVFVHLVETTRCRHKVKRDGKEVPRSEALQHCSDACRHCGDESKCSRVSSNRVAAHGHLQGCTCDMRWLVVTCKGCNSPGNQRKFGAATWVEAADLVPYPACTCGRRFKRDDPREKIACVMDPSKSRRLMLAHHSRKRMRKTKGGRGVPPSTRRRHE